MITKNAVQFNTPVTLYQLLTIVDRRMSYQGQREGFCRHRCHIPHWQR